MGLKGAVGGGLGHTAGQYTDEESRNAHWSQIRAHCIHGSGQAVVQEDEKADGAGGQGPLADWGACAGEGLKWDTEAEFGASLGSSALEKTASPTRRTVARTF
jgi:hypothetical protein|uniref:Uncharacterized protein n=1 Tax=Eutreptiella gymnastica TaxID=73025 RepID=A0A7S4CJM3_9EUGL|mmetsp:Transcript_81748/g.136658  ORF Transcript_81748/g.136658 Transcript_81748/m.136658 type:complete len:103 (+) Transcript_81748:837-1145(+)|eukprot:CAMPEP_0174291050 /NCGR_PEP_ID=MMETSP0809-20121228/30919_1 /TAXON_ID=73025 ORGANISM="Eutreptiella gymnastica-like, Strain CCMP1594" /NCGR_SAMPLE_ID=MMETSP0809 /ASSEMBLY_ACC=CAM_ASM_000658 /LENGTH=102 /DNA_ID=CAMNT_0015390167 /DNA_START=819 /DNA_END=1127 /DNA_ORIENTATION=+